MRFRTVLFDFDGTLVDSGGMILASFRHATRTVLGREIPDRELVAAVGGSSIHAQMEAFDRERVADLVRVYREHNEPLHDELQAFAGVEELLAELVAQGRKLGIVTAKRRPTVDLAFRVLPIERYFDVIVTTESTERGKPHPDPVLFALAALGAEPSESVFVGDSPFDIEAGKAAGVFAVGVLWGKIHDESRLAEAGADVLVTTPAELLREL